MVSKKDIIHDELIYAIDAIVTKNMIPIRIFFWNYFLTTKKSLKTIDLSAFTY